jgi:hypothetical protein
MSDFNFLIIKIEDMKTFYKLIRCFFTILFITLIGSSCSESFLDEQLKTQRNIDHFNTEEGIADAVVALHNDFRYLFNRERGYCHTMYGTDEFTVGGDNSNHDWNDYTSNLSPLVVAINSNTIPMNDVWDNMYRTINLANIVLDKVDEVVANEANRTRYKAEASFVRAYSYFFLVQQYGGVVLKLRPSEGVERYFVRSSRQECVNQIIEDFRVAYAGLPAVEPAEGRLYKDVAAHFLAKALLYRVSEINDEWNSTHKTSDLAEIITLCDEVISKHPLATNFSELFDFQSPDGPNEFLPEIIFSAQFTNVTPAAEGNSYHLYFVSQYNNLTGFTRDIAGGREYQRLRPSRYLLDVFDRTNDSRIWKSFRTKSSLNNSNTTGQLSGTDPNSGKNYTYELGDLGLIYILNDKADTRFSTSTSLIKNHTGVYYYNPYSGKPTPHTYVLNLAEGDDHFLSVGFKNRFPSLNKWYDGSRPNHNYGDGARDGILARSAETYLIKAEALIRQEKYNDAIQVINIVRRRAQFKNGEDRATYTDGGAAYLNNTAGQQNYADGVKDCSFRNRNSYYESLNIPETTEATDLTNYTVSNLPPEDEAVIAKLGYTSNYDRMMCFLLNERTRELTGEFQRWPDLARTKTLLDRAKAFNIEAAPNITEKHYLRPIPQQFLDAIHNEKGQPLSAEEKKAMQNPGY